MIDVYLIGIWMQVFQTCVCVFNADVYCDLGWIMIGIVMYNYDDPCSSPYDDMMVFILCY